MTKMPYSLYKPYYNQFPSRDYNPNFKTIKVDIPPYRKKHFPSAWKKNGNRYFTPGGCEVIFWNAGYAENFVVRRWFPNDNTLEQTIHPGVDARDRVLECVAAFEAI